MERPLAERERGDLRQAGVVVRHGGDGLLQYAVKVAAVAGVGLAGDLLVACALAGVGELDDPRDARGNTAGALHHRVVEHPLVALPLVPEGDVEGVDGEIGVAQRRAVEDGELGRADEPRGERLGAFEDGGVVVDGAVAELLLVARLALLDVALEALAVRAAELAAAVGVLDGGGAVGARPAVGCVEEALVERSIPACAGEPYQTEIAHHAAPVYPRVCGGTTIQVFQDLPAINLSPRVRGNHAPGAVDAPGGGSIPACAGEPHGEEHVDFRHGVYPRVCGGTRPWLGR